MVNFDNSRTVGKSKKRSPFGFVYMYNSIYSQGCELFFLYLSYRQSKAYH